LQSTRGTATEFSIATSSSALDQMAPRPCWCFGIHHHPWPSPVTERRYCAPDPARTAALKL
jgi:hypothetical protein